MTESDYSVLMVVRNGAHYIAHALASLQAQDHPPAEVLVIDDGSDDDTCAIVRRVMPRARVASFPPGGVGAALNRGVARIDGDHIAFLDHDDTWDPGKARWQAAALAGAVGPAVIVGSVVNVVERDGGVVRREPMGPARVLGACLMTRATLEVVGPFLEDDLHHTIVDWWSRADVLGVPTTTIDRPALNRRIHGGNIGVTRKADSQAHLLRHLRVHRQRQSGGAADGR